MKTFIIYEWTRFLKVGAQNFMRRKVGDILCYSPIHPSHWLNSKKKLYEGEVAYSAIPPTDRIQKKAFPKLEFTSLPVFHIVLPAIIIFYLCSSTLLSIFL